MKNILQPTSSKMLLTSTADLKLEFLVICLIVKMSYLKINTFFSKIQVLISNRDSVGVKKFIQNGLNFQSSDTAPEIIQYTTTWQISGRLDLRIFFAFLLNLILNKILNWSKLQWTECEKRKRRNNFIWKILILAWKADSWG